MSRHTGRLQRVIVRIVFLFLITVMSGLIMLGLYSALHRDFWTRMGSTIGPMAEQRLPRVAIVLTGESRRISFALDQMERGRFDRLLIAGAGHDSARFVSQFKLSDRLQRAMARGDIELADRSTSTLENAIEAYCWLRQYPSISEITLITSTAHMPRASLAFDRALGAGYQVFRLVSDERIEDGRSTGRMLEWHKFLATWFISLTPQPMWVTGDIEPCSRLGRLMVLRP